MANEIQMGVPAHGEVNDSKGKSVKKSVKKIKTKAETKTKTKRNGKLNTSKFEIKYTEKAQPNEHLFI